MTDKTAGVGPVEPTVRPALVERLRRNADGWLPTSDHTLEAHNLLTEAAAEIERLNAWAVAYYQDTRGAILAERERCARICDQLDAMSLDPMVCRGSAQECAEAIRHGLDCGESGHTEGKCGNESCLRGPNAEVSGCLRAPMPEDATRTAAGSPLDRPVGPVAGA